MGEAGGRALSASEDLLRQGKAAAREGRRDDARRLLVAALEADERNEQAWLWLAGVLDDPADIRECLEMVLSLNPANDQARRGLSWLADREPPPALERAVNETLTPVVSAPHPQPVSVLRPAAAPSRAVAVDDGPPAPRTVAFTAPLPLNDTPIAASSPAPPLPCPFCGGATARRDRRCPACRRSLMLREMLPEEPSVLLSALAALWSLAGYAAALAGVAALIAALWFELDLRRRGAPDASPLIALPGLALLGFGLLQIVAARGLRRRSSTAYWLAVALPLLGIPLWGAVMAFGTMQLRLQVVNLVPGGLPREIINALALGVTLFPIVTIGVLLLYLLLAALSFRDFYPPRVRFVPEVAPAGHQTHFRNGIAYRDRGMWYMAAREWEAAIERRPRDPQYLHALGLAYARLGQPDRARAALDRALALAPDDPRIRASRAVVDRDAL